ncbi:MAG: hypothetical protein Alpg2KO_03500 [Alphaproteobacteria bacterium]
MPAQQDTTELQDLVHRVIKRVMLCLAMADGKVDRAEANQIAEIYEELTGAGITADEMTELAEAQGADVDTLLDWLNTVRPALTLDGKRLVITAALLVIGADGELDEGEMTLLSEIGVALDLDPEMFKQIVTQALDD